MVLDKDKEHSQMLMGKLNKDTIIPIFSGNINNSMS